MFSIAYRFPVQIRHRDSFLHAYRSAQDTLLQTLGLQEHALIEPRDRHAAISLTLTWRNLASFQRFTRTWIGVWMLNGMGLPREAFSAAIESEPGVDDAQE